LALLTPVVLPHQDTGCVGQSQNWKIFVEVGKLALVRAQEVVVLTVYTIIDMT